MTLNFNSISQPHYGSIESFIQGVTLSRHLGIGNFSMHLGNWWSNKTVCKNMIRCLIFWADHTLNVTFWLLDIFFFMWDQNVPILLYRGNNYVREWYYLSTYNYCAQNSITLLKMIEAFAMIIPVTNHFWASFLVIFSLFFTQKDLSFCKLRYFRYRMTIKMQPRLDINFK